LKICVSVCEPTAEGCLKALEGLELAEIRIDCADLTEAQVREIFGRKVELVATCRPGGKHDEETRKRLLLAAVEAGARYVDLEMEAADSLKKEVGDRARALGCKVIVSYHDYERTPPLRQLEHVVDWCLESGADLVKVACQVQSDRDNARLLGLLDSQHPLIVVGMGDKGRMTRVVAPLLGSAFTYASFSRGKETAPGQIDREALERVASEIRRVL